MKNNKKRIIFIAVIIVIMFFLLPNPFPYPLEKDLDAFDISPVSDTIYISDEYDVGKKTIFLYSALCKTSDNDEFMIGVGTRNGIFNNRYNLYSRSYKIDSNILSKDYINVGVYPEDVVQNWSFSKIYGLVYAGTVPKDCISVVINGEECILIDYNFQLNGVEADFKLYYYIVENDDYLEDDKVICTKSNGEIIKIDLE